MLSQRYLRRTRETQHQLLAKNPQNAEKKTHNDKKSKVVRRLDEFGARARREATFLLVTKYY